MTQPIAERIFCTRCGRNMKDCGDGYVSCPACETQCDTIDAHLKNVFASRESIKVRVGYED